MSKSKDKAFWVGYNAWTKMQNKGREKEKKKRGRAQRLPTYLFERISPMQAGAIYRERVYLTQLPMQLGLTDDAFATIGAILT